MRHESSISLSPDWLSRAIRHARRSMELLRPFLEHEAGLSGDAKSSPPQTGTEEGAGQRIAAVTFSHYQCPRCKWVMANTENNQCWCGNPACVSFRKRYWLPTCELMPVCDEVSPRGETRQSSEN